MRPSELVPGNCYFSVHYHDVELLFPEIQTLIYPRADEYVEDGRRVWIFEDAASWTSTVDGESEDQILVGFPDEPLSGILDLAGLMRVLGELAVDHPRNPLEPTLGPASEVDLGDLRSTIGQFFLASESESVTITIDFTDDGLSLGRRPDGSNTLSFFPRTRINPARETELRAACLAHGLTPEQDYLADRGRTRILVYAVRPDDVSNLAKLAARIFQDVYCMRRGDVQRNRFRSAVAR